MRPLDEVMGLAAASNGSAYVTAAGTTSWSDWAVKVERYRQQVRHLDRVRIGLVARPLPDTFAVLAALILNRRHVFLIDEMGDEKAVARLLEDHGLEAVVRRGSRWTSHPEYQHAVRRIGRGMDHALHFREHGEPQGSPT